MRKYCPKHWLERELQQQREPEKSQVPYRQLDNQQHWEWSNISYSRWKFIIRLALLISMFNYSARRSTKKKALQLHQILRDYKRFEQEKQMLQNRINIMHNNQIKNNNKAKTIQLQFMKIKEAQQERKENQRSMEKEIMEYQKQEIAKKREMIKKVKEEKKKILTSKKFYAEFKKQEGQRVKSESKVFYEIIAATAQSEMAKNQERRKQVNEGQTKGRARIDMFRTSRLESLKAEQGEKFLKQLKVNKSTQNELKNLQKIQKEMVLKYSESLSSLKNSRCKIQKMSSIRA